MENLQQPTKQNILNGKVVLGLQEQKTVQVVFEDDTFASISKLGSVFRRIRRRMENDGYTIKDGILKKKYE